MKLRIACLLFTLFSLIPSLQAAGCNLATVVGKYAIVNLGQEAGSYLVALFGIGGIMENGVVSLLMGVDAGTVALETAYKR
jgi:hypothetical protein